MPVYKPRRRDRREEPLLDSNNEIQVTDEYEDDEDGEFQSQHDYDDHFLASEESIPPLMKACITTHYNFDHPEDSVKYVEDFPVPKDLSPNQVLVRVVCASINPLDYKVMQGKFKLENSFSPPGVLGRDASGIVAKLGSNAAKRFKIGDEVFGRKGADNGFGTYAQYAVFDYRNLALIPDDLMFSEAAAIPTSGLSVFQGFETAKRKGASFDEVLIHGGSGGAGSLAILLAKHYYGAKRVYATTSTKNINYVKSLGADEVIDYTNEKFEEVIGKRIFSKNRHRQRPPLTLVFDTIGGYNIVDMSMKLMSPNGYYIQIAIPKEIDMNPSFTYYFEIIRFRMYVLFWRFKRWFSTKGPYYEWITTGSDGKQLYKVASILARHGHIKKLQIEKCFLVDMIEAITVSRSRRAVGKIVVQIPKKQPHISLA